LLQVVGRQLGEVAYQPASGRQQVDFYLAGIKAHGIACRNDASPIRTIEDGTRLAEARAQCAARIVRHIPEHRAEAVAPMQTPSYRQIDQQRARLAGRGQDKLVAATGDLDPAQYAHGQPCRLGQSAQPESRELAAES